MNPASAWANSLPTQYRIEQWTTENGLPQNSVRAILQTRDGYLWFTTSDGLVRFDGVHFTVFDKSSNPGVVSNRFTALYESPDGSLWAGTDTGITRYKDGRFTSYSAGERPTGENVSAITGDDAGHIWVRSQHRILQWRAGTVVPCPSCEFPEWPDVEGSITQWHYQGGFWAQSEKGLTVFRNGNTSHPSAGAALRHDKVFNVAEDERGSLWVATTSQLMQFRGEELLSVQKRPQSCVSNLEIYFIPGLPLEFACRDNSGAVSFFGINSLKRIRAIAVPSNVSIGLEAATFYRDRERNFWLGSFRSGLFKIHKQAVTLLSREQGLVDNSIYPILQDRAGAVWLGAWPGTLARWQNGLFTNFPLKEGRSSYPISSLLEDSHGRLWVACYSPRHRLWNFSRGRFSVPPEPRGLDTIRAMLEDRNGVLWFATEDSLVSFDGAVTRHYTTANGLAANYSNVLIEGSGGVLWIGGYGGLTRLCNGNFTAFTPREGLPSGSIRALYEDSNGVLWIGTYDGGLARLEKGRFTKYTTREGLFNNGVFQILEDSQANFWMSCNRGIYRVSKRDLNDIAHGTKTILTSISYGKDAGMRTVECNGGHWPAGIKAKDGKLWFPTQDGAAVIDPRSLTQNSIPPPVVIESRLVDRVPMPADRPVTLNPRQDNLELQYTALSFIDSDRTQFRYKLEGLDEGWVNAGTRRTAYYSHLPPGEYEFRVIAANSEGVWNMKGQQLHISVLAPFYRTTWFIILILLVLGAIVMSVWRSRVKGFETARQRQQAFSRQLMASQEGERKRIAAELHDSLGQRLVMIKNLALLSLMNGSADVQRQQLERISEETSGAIGDVKEISYDLRPYQLDRLGVSKAITAFVHAASSASAIHISTSVDNLDGFFSKDVEIHFYRIVQECVNNIVKHSEATEAEVTVRLLGRRLLLMIYDNGKGFASPREQNPNHGFGLLGIQERAEALGGRAQIETAPGQGATIKIEIDRSFS